MAVFLSVWVAPIITGLIVWYITAKYGSNLVTINENRENLQKSNPPSDLPLTTKFEGKEPPIGYYKLSDTEAKRMEPKFCLDMKSYLVQPISVCLFSLIMLPVAFSNFPRDPEFSSSIIIWASMNLLVLFPWRAIRKN